MVGAARAAGRDRAETTLEDGTTIQVILRPEPQKGGALARLLAAVKQQKPAQN
jgi:hypothetical protein